MRAGATAGVGLGSFFQLPSSFGLGDFWGENVGLFMTNRSIAEKDCKLINSNLRLVREFTPTAVHSSDWVCFER